VEGFTVFFFILNGCWVLFFLFFSITEEAILGVVWNRWTAGGSEGRRMKVIPKKNEDPN